MHNKIIILDKNDTNRSALNTILKPDYLIFETQNASETLSLLEKSEAGIAAIVIDMLTSENDGFELLKEMKDHAWNNKIPVLVVCDSAAVNMEKELFTYGVSECINQPFDNALIRLKVSNIVKLFQYQNELEQKIEAQTGKLRLQNQVLKMQAEFLQKSNTRIIDLLGSMAEYRNLESGEHIQRVKIYTKILAKELMKEDPACGLTEEKIAVIVSASPLHDIGKIAIPDTILLKPGKLTDEEYEYIKSHTICGCEIIEKIKDIWNKEYAQISMDICRYHHERYDGNGYPDRLKGDEIPIHAQLVSVADVYDALVHERVYKEALPKDRAYRMIIHGECGIFSPTLMTCLANCRTEMEAV